MATVRRIVVAAAGLTAMARAASARPVLDTPQQVGRLTVYADDQRRGLFYFGPGELDLVRAANGRPEFHFLSARYTGSAVTADRGRLLHRGLITFRVAMQAPAAADLQAARAALGGNGPVDLRPLPIQRLDADLVYAPVGTTAGSTALPAGHFEEAAQPGAAAGAGSFWTTRTFSLGLDAASSELFWDALAKGQVVLSVSYAFHASDAPAADDGGGEPRTERKVVRAGAFAVSVDIARWPDLFRRVDIGERVPPDYPLLDVYCYDFRDALHPALYEKQVEVEAEGVGGRPIAARARFGRNQPDLYARSIRFGMAIRLDLPYRYRVMEVTEDGRTTVSPWRPRASWAELLDVTTPRDAASDGEEER